MTTTATISRKRIREIFRAIKAREGVQAALELYPEPRDRFEHWSIAHATPPEDDRCPWKVSLNLQKVGRLKLNDEEVEGLLAHELCHVKEGDHGSYNRQRRIVARCVFVAGLFPVAFAISPIIPSDPVWLSLAGATALLGAIEWGARWLTPRIAWIECGPKNHPRELAADAFSIRSCGHDGIIRAIKKHRRFHFMGSRTHPSVWRREREAKKVLQQLKAA
ncbi:MAG: hypothetical protein AB7G06_04045 [Bdellovibrionales bacterium]